MNKIIARKGNCIASTLVFCAKPELTLSAKETALVASLTTHKASLFGAAGTQFTGKRGWSEGSDERIAIAREVRVTLRDIAEIAKSLHETGTDVGALEAFRMPESKGYPALVATARAFAALVEPRKAAFIEYGLAATFVEDLEAKIDLLEDSETRPASGRLTQVGGTAGLAAAADAGMVVVRQLRCIMRHKLRNNQALLAEWKSASRVARAGEAEPVLPGDPAPPSGGGSSTPPSGS